MSFEEEGKLHLSNLTIEVILHASLINRPSPACKDDSL